ncbi:hypothetical protein [Arcanobacterium canis]
MTAALRALGAFAFLALAARQAVGVEYPLPTYALIARLGLMVFSIALAAIFILAPFEEPKTIRKTTARAPRREPRVQRRPIYQDLRPKGTNK